MLHFLCPWKEVTVFPIREVPTAHPHKLYEVMIPMPFFMIIFLKDE